MTDASDPRVFPLAEEAYWELEEICLDLSARTFNTLKKAGFERVVELASRTPEELLTIDGIGPKAIEEIERALRVHKFHLCSREDVRAQRQVWLGMLSRIARHELTLVVTDDAPHWSHNAMVAAPNRFYG